MAVSGGVESVEGNDVGGDAEQSLSDAWSEWEDSPREDAAALLSCCLLMSVNDDAESAAEYHDLVGICQTLPMQAITELAGSRRPVGGSCANAAKSDFAASWSPSKASLLGKLPPIGRCADDAFREGLRAENQTLQTENGALREAVAKARQGVQRRLDRSYARSEGSVNEKDLSRRRALQKVLPKKIRPRPGAALDSPREDAVAGADILAVPEQAITVDLVAPRWRQQTPPMSTKAMSALKAVAADVDFSVVAKEDCSNCFREGDLIAPG